MDGVAASVAGLVVFCTVLGRVAMRCRLVQRGSLRALHAVTPSSVGYVSRRDQASRCRDCHRGVLQVIHSVSCAGGSEPNGLDLRVCAAAQSWIVRSVDRCGGARGLGGWSHCSLPSVSTPTGGMGVGHCDSPKSRIRRMRCGAQRHRLRFG